MAVDERSGHVLQNRLEQVLGADDAERLMAHLREIGRGDLVTTAALDERFELFEQRLLRTWREELGELRSELHAEMGALRSELHSELRSELGALRSELRSELHAEVGGLRSELGGLYARSERQTRTLLFGLLGANATFAGLVFAAVRFV